MKRKAIIYRPSKTAMQSGRAKTRKWVLEFSSDDRKFVDPMMGWIGGKDTTRQLKMQFDSQEEAIRYAERNNLEYILKDPHQRKVKPKSYAENFAYNARQYSDIAGQGSA